MPQRAIVRAEHHPPHLGEHDARRRTGRTAPASRTASRTGSRSSPACCSARWSASSSAWAVGSRRWIVSLCASPRISPFGDDHRADRHLLAHRGRARQAERGLHARQVARRRRAPTHWPSRAPAPPRTEAHVIAVALDPDGVALAEVALQQLQRDRVLQLALDHPLERPGAVHRIVALRRRAAPGPPASPRA